MDHLRPVNSNRNFVCFQIWIIVGHTSLVRTAVPARTQHRTSTVAAVRKAFQVWTVKWWIIRASPVRAQTEEPVRKRQDSFTVFVLQDGQDLRVERVSEATLFEHATVELKSVVLYSRLVTCVVYILPVHYFLYKRRHILCYVVYAIIFTLLLKYFSKHW